MDETYYELIPLTIDGHEDGDAVFADPNLNVLIEGAIERRFDGEYDQFSIVQTVRLGDEATHYEVAYMAAEDPEASGQMVLRIVDPARIAEFPEWLPGGAGATFRIGNSRERVVPLMDPGSMPGRAQLLNLVASLPYYRDTSYGNDVAPSRSFAIGETPYRIFIAPGRTYLRSADHLRQYSLFEIDRAQGQDVSEAIQDDDVIWDEILNTEDPAEVIDFIEKRMAEPVDATAARAALLDLGPKRRSYRPGRDDPQQFSDLEKRAALLEIGHDDPTLNPSRRRRARRNPDDIAEAKAKFEEFHRHPPRKFFEGDTSPIPAKVRELGKAKAVLYRSDKNDPDTGRPVKKPINYIHEHDAGVRCYTPSNKDATVAVPAFIKDAESLVLLGKCLGFDFEDKSGVREAKGIKPLPDLYATPCGKALVVIQDRRDVLAIIWGGGLAVESRGIVG